MKRAMDRGWGTGAKKSLAVLLLALTLFVTLANSQSSNAAPNAALPPAAQTPVHAADLTPLPQALPDSLRPDSLAARRAPTRADTTLIVKHRFNHRQQIITGSAIMASLAMVMVVMNNYNPRGFED